MPDAHPLMSRMHRPGDEKRSLVIVAPDEFESWLRCGNPEIARTFSNLYPANSMRAWPVPKPPNSKKQIASQ